MERKPAALIVPASLGEPVILGRLDTDPAALRRLVGGDVESISRGDWHVYPTRPAEPRSSSATPARPPNPTSRHT